MTLRVIVPPAQEPITLTQAKMNLRVDVDDEDDLITGHIIAARQYCEQYQNRAYAQQTLELTLDDFPLANKFCIVLQRPPIQQVLYVNYYGTDNSLNVWDPSLYFADIDSDPGRISPNFAQYYPVLQLRPINGVKVGFVAGQLPVVTTVAMPAGTSPAPTAGTVTNADGTTTVTVLNGDGSATATTTDYCANVPQNVKQAMLLLIGHWFENREVTMERRASTEMLFSVNALLGIDRVWNA
jgi:uncharacterized phiE125 gp8 family phage protein